MKKERIKQPINIILIFIILSIIIIPQIRSSADSIDTFTRLKIIGLEYNNKSYVYNPNTELIRGYKFNSRIGFLIKNIDKNLHNYSYEIKMIENNCKIDETSAINIITNKAGHDIRLNSSDIEAILIKLDIPEDFKPCKIKYVININEENSNYDNQEFQVTIIKKRSAFMNWLIQLFKWNKY